MAINLALLGLGSKHWPLKATLAALKGSSEPWGIQVFDDFPGLFGDPRPALRKLLATGKIDFVEVQLSYTKTHTLTPMDFIERRMPVWREFARQFPNTTFMVSHTTEHMEREKKLLWQRMGAIRGGGEINPINNPEPGKGAILDGETNETHGMDTLRQIDYLASMDGWDAMGRTDTFTFLKNHRLAERSFVWCSRFNMQDGTQYYDYEEARKANRAPKDAFPPAIRKGAPSLKHLRSMIAASDLFCLPPAKSPSLIEIKGPHLYKPFSQDTNDGRLDMPVLIVKGSKKPFEVVAANGKVLGIFEYYAPFTGGLSRYYSGQTKGRAKSMNLWGFQIANKALKVAGTPWVYFRQDGKNYGWVHPCYRFGYF